MDKSLVHLQGRTPLWLACDAGHADQVEVLLAAGADVNAKSFPHEKYQILMGVSNPGSPVIALFSLRRVRSCRGIAFQCADCSNDCSTPSAA